VQANGESVPVGSPFDERHHLVVLGIEEDLARSQFGRGTHERRPSAVMGFEKQNFDGAAAASTQSESCRNHPGVIDDEHVIGAHQIGQIANVSVMTPVATVDQETCGISGFDGLLCDELVGKGVIEIGDVHGSGEQVGL
jgi:hypothetical protein